MIKEGLVRRFKVIYLTGGRGAEVIEADDYIDDGRSIIFRRRMKDGSFEDLMRVRADAVQRIETPE